MGFWWYVESSWLSYSRTKTANKVFWMKYLFQNAIVENMSRSREYAIDNITHKVAATLIYKELSRVPTIVLEICPFRDEGCAQYRLAEIDLKTKSCSPITSVSVFHSFCFVSLHRRRQYHCRPLYRIVKRLGKWKKLRTDAVSQNLSLRWVFDGCLILYCTVPQNWFLTLSSHWIDNISCSRTKTIDIGLCRLCYVQLEICN